MEQTIGDALRAAAAEVPDRPAVVEGSPGPGPRRRLSYAELLGHAERVARALLARFRPGEHVAVWSGNSLEWILLEYGAALAGLVLVTVNPAYQAGELSYVLRQSRSAGLFHVAQYRGNPMADIVAEVRDGPAGPAGGGGAGGVRRVLRRSRPDARAARRSRPGDRVQIQYTSGTTGFPKGVLLRHRGMVGNARLTAERMGVRPGDVLVWPMPLFHTAGCGMGVLGALTTRATIVYLTAFDPALQLELIEAEQATVSGGVPTMLIALLGHPDLERRDLSSLRCNFSGGSPVPVDVARETERRLGGRISIVFGTTETLADHHRHRPRGSGAGPHRDARRPAAAHGGHDRRPGDGFAGARRRGGRAVRARVPGHAGLLRPARRHRRGASTARAGTTPAIWPRWTPRATSASRADSRT